MKSFFIHNVKEWTAKQWNNDDSDCWWHELYEDTNPEAAEVRVGIVICFVVRLHQRGDDLALFVSEPGPPRLPLCFALRLLVLPPLNQVLLPLHFLICQNDWGCKCWETKSESVRIIHTPTHRKNKLCMENTVFTQAENSRATGGGHIHYQNWLKAHHFNSISVCTCVLHCDDNFVNAVLGGGGLLFSRGREWEGTGPYGDPCCIEQLNALSLFCSLLVVLATELAHRDIERETERESLVSTTSCCFCNSNATGSRSCTVNLSVGATTLVVFPGTLWGRSMGLEVRGLSLKEACGQYADIGRKQEKNVPAIYRQWK